MTDTIVHIAQRHARARGDQLAYAALVDGATVERRLTFAELDTQARAIAHALLGHAQPGDRAVLVYDAGLDFVSALLGCLYARIVAVPIPAPEASRVQNSLARLDAVLRNCDARLLLGNAHTHGLLQGSQGSAGQAARSDLVQLDTTQITLAMPVGRADTPDLPLPVRADLAYLQYTSGSTSTPKGVMIGHDNIVRHCDGIREGLGYDADSVSVCWMPHFHDYGLIEGIFVPLANGTPSYLMSPFAFLKRPATWLEAIAKYRGTHTQAFNFAYRYCARRVTPQQRATLDLSSLRSAGNGGEPIHPDTSSTFAQTFAECGLRPQALAPVFGLAEATLLVTAVPPDETPLVLHCDADALGQGRLVPIVANGCVAPGPGAAAPAGTVAVTAAPHRLVACGRALPETVIAIVDPEACRPMPPGEIGEIWVAAPGVASGYWQREAESEATLHAHIAGDDSGTPYLRTGDLGVMHDGQLYITARRKDLIIIRGTNLHPQDIEWTVQNASPLLRADHGAAFGVLVDGEERLCVVQEIERGDHDDEALRALINAIVEAVSSEHGVALHGIALIRRGSIKKTTSGKIQRNASRRDFLAGTLKPVLTWPPAIGAGAVQA